MKTIGERIRQAREKRKISGDELARSVGYTHQSAIANLENRNIGTGGRKISEIAKALNVPLEWIINGPDSEDVPDALPLFTHQESEGRPSQHVVEEADPKSDALMAEGMRLLSNLTFEGKRQAVIYLRFLHASGTLNPHDAPWKDNPLSKSKAA